MMYKINDTRVIKNNFQETSKEFTKNNFELII